MKWWIRISQINTYLYFSLIYKLWRDIQRNKYYVMLYFPMMEFHKSFSHDMFINQRKPWFPHFLTSFIQVTPANWQIAINHTNISRLNDWKIIIWWGRLSLLSSFKWTSILDLLFSARALSIIYTKLSWKRGCPSSWQLLMNISMKQ